MFGSMLGAWTVDGSDFQEDVFFWGNLLRRSSPHVFWWFWFHSFYQCEDVRWIPLQDGENYLMKQLGMIWNV